MQYKSEQALCWPSSIGKCEYCCGDGGVVVYGKVALAQGQTSLVVGSWERGSGPILIRKTLPYITTSINLMVGLGQGHKAAWPTLVTLLYYAVLQDNVTG